MIDLLQKASEWLENKRTKYATCVVTYARGSQTAQVPATVGKTVFEVDEGFNILLRYEARDFLILTVDLVLGGIKTLPQKGDRIYETQDDTIYTYEVLAPGKEPCWRFSDPWRKTLRIHTKQTAAQTTIFDAGNLFSFNAAAYKARTFKAWTSGSGTVGCKNLASFGTLTFKARIFKAWISGN